MTLNVIVPAYNESQNGPYFYGRAHQALDSIQGLDRNIVFVNNSSEDDTLEQMRLLRSTDPRETPRIQEVHGMIVHILCELIEAEAAE